MDLKNRQLNKYKIFNFFLNVLIQTLKKSNEKEPFINPLKNFKVNLQGITSYISKENIIKRKN